MSSARHRRESPAAVLRDVGFGSTTPLLAPEEVEHRQTFDDLIDVVRFDVPNAVPPNTVVPVTVEVNNGAEFLLFGDDVCTENFFNGLLVQVDLAVDGDVVDTQTECVRGSNEEQQRYELSFVAPSAPGSYDVSVSTEGGNSGDPGETQTKLLEVSSDAPQPGECSRDQDCPGDQVCEDGTCVDPAPPGGSDLFSQAAVILGLLALIVIGLAAGG